MDREKLIDLLLRIHFVNNSPAAAGAFTMAWVHGMKLEKGVTYIDQFQDVCELIGLPKELSKPKYPETVWAVFENNSKIQKNKIINYITNLDSNQPKNKEVFSDTVQEVHDWAKEHEGGYSYISSTGRTVISEEQAFEAWKIEIFKEIGLPVP